MGACTISSVLNSGNCYWRHSPSMWPLVRAKVATWLHGTTTLITLLPSSPRQWASLEATREWHLTGQLPFSGVPSLETATPVVPDPQLVISLETSSHPSDNSAQLETPPASTSPMRRRSSRSRRPDQRLTEEMWIWTLPATSAVVVAIDWLFG